MMILVVGRPGSGKSEKAEALSVKLAGDGPLIYLATMIPYGEEGARRVERHRKLREGKGFVTVERAREVGGLASSEATVLLECAANLCANVMFEAKEHNGISLGQEEAAAIVTDDIFMLERMVKQLVVVTDDFPPEEDYDEETLAYIGAMRRINRVLSREADRVITITEG